MKQPSTANHLLILFLLVLVFSCVSEPAEEKMADETFANFEEAELINLNPERTELAQLMLLMHAKTEALKTQINNGDSIIAEDYLIDIERVTQVENDINHHSFEDFTKYNDILLEQAKALQNVTENPKETYNKLVNSCILCHDQFCPKMVQKIEKLIIE